jgi:hypothetical protein
MKLPLIVLPLTLLIVAALIYWPATAMHRTNAPPPAASQAHVLMDPITFLWLRSEEWKASHAFPVHSV